MKGKNKRSFKGKGRNPRTSERCEERRGAPDYESPRNDISWYSRNPNLLVAAGSFPYPYRPGMKVDLGTAKISSEKSTIVESKRSFNIPGVMSLNWMPSIGTSNTATDPASITAKEIYSRVRQKYSGALDADAPDFLVYLLSLDSIFSYIAWLKRLYRVLNAWSPENYALPDVVLGAMYVTQPDVQALRNSRTQLWQGINELVLQSRKFTCPASMDIFNRHYWMSDNVYTDDPNINSQFFMFNLWALYQYAELPMPSGDNAAGLKMVQMPTIRKYSSGTPPTLSVDTLITFGRDLIEALVAWDDAYTINGYLMRAYEGEPTFIVDELPADQPFNPVYEPEVLSQIENSRAIPGGTRGITELSGFNVTQNVLTNAIISNPKYTVAANFDSQNTFACGGYTVPPTLSVRSMSPTVADSVIASRLQAVSEVTVNSDNTKTVVVTCATEVPVGWLIWTAAPVFQDPFNGVGSPSVYEQAPTILLKSTDTSITINNYLSSLQSALTSEQFDWHPFAFVGFARSDNTGAVYGAGSPAILGDTHNFTVITSEDLRNLHKVCLFSELNSFSLS